MGSMYLYAGKACFLTGFCAGAKTARYVDNFRLGHGDGLAELSAR